MAARLSARRAGEQPLRPQDQEHDHDRVDDEGSEPGNVIFAGNVSDADEEGSEERPGNARGTADRYHDEKIDHVFQWKGRIETEDLRAQRAAEPRQPRAEGEGEREHSVDVDAEPAGDARIVDRCAQAAAETRFGQDELQRHREDAADDNDEQAIASDADAEELEAALQRARDL